MSRPLLPAWRIAVFESDLDPTAKLVALAIETFMDSKTGFAYPSRATIASRAGLSLRAVERAITRAEAAGFLSVFRTRGRKVNRYLALIPNSVSRDAVEEGANSVPRDAPTASHGTPLTASHGTPELASRTRQLNSPRPGAGAGAVKNDREDPARDDPQRQFVADLQRQIGRSM